MTASTPGAKAGRREWTGLAVIALPCLLYSMDLTVLNLALPALSADLKPSATQMLWIIDVYGFMVAGLLITMGTLGDRIGRRRLLMLGAAFFGVASVLAAFARSAEMLIAMRALLGVAGATIAPSTLSLIRNMFHDEGERTVAIGVWISAYSLGGVVGPLLGGVVLEHFSWGAVFLLAVPVMVLLLVAGPLLLPEYRDPQPRPLDLPSAALSLAAVLGTIWGLKHMAEHGVSWLPAASIALGVLLAFVFVRRQARLAEPLVDLRLFRVPAFSASLGTYMLGCFVLFGMFVFIAQYLQLVLGLAPLRAGLCTVPLALSFVVGSMLTPLLVKAVRTAHVVAGGLLLAAAGFGLLAQAGDVQDLVLLIAATVLVALGLAPVFTLATDLVVGSAPPERAGAASAISETGAELGGALGIAVFGTLGAAVYRGAMAQAVPGLPAGVAEAARATLGGASAVAAELPPAASEALLAAARTAFIDGMQWTAALAAVALVVAAVVAAMALREARAQPSPTMS